LDVLGSVGATGVVVKVSGTNAVMYNGTNYLGGGKVSLPGSNNIPIVAWLGTNSTEINRTVYMPPAKPQAFLYDLNGNLTNDGQRAYYWDEENRLVAVETQGDAGIPACEKKRSEYLYDAQGRRARKTDLSGWTGSAYAATNVTGYVWDGWLLLAETDAADGVAAYHVHGLDLSQSLQGAGGIGGLLCRIESGTNYCYAFDGNGNVADVTTSGAVAAHYDYDPFGRTVSESGPYASANSWRFSTKQTDDWGFYYYGYRYYNPSLGRWITRDPITDLAFLRRHLPTLSPLDATRIPWRIPKARTRSCRGRKNTQEVPMELALDGAPYSFFSRGQTQTDALGLYMQPNGCATSGGGLMLGCDSPQAPCMTSGRCVTRSGGVNFIEYESCLCCVEMTGWFDFGFCKKIKGRVMICYGPDPDANCYYRLLSIEAKRCCCPKGENCRSFSRCWRWEDRFR
jgi:RHS repeat-associated protein